LKFSPWHPSAAKRSQCLRGHIPAALHDDWFESNGTIRQEAHGITWTARGAVFRQAGDHPMVSLAQQDSIAHGFPAVGFPYLCLICWKVN